MASLAAAEAAAEAEAVDVYMISRKVVNNMEVW